MAFDHTNFCTIVGEYSQMLRAVDTQIAAFETAKEDIRDAYATPDLEDLYGGVPQLVTSLQGSFTSIASGLVSHLTNCLMAVRDFVTEQLISNQTGTTGVLNALHTYMVANSISIKKSVTTFDGSLNGEEGTYSGSSDEAVSEGKLSIGTSLIIMKSSGGSSSSPSKKVSLKGVTYIYHVVEPGDNIWRIARKYKNVTVDELYLLNNLSKGSTISLGDRIKVPSK